MIFYTSHKKTTRGKMGKYDLLKMLREFQNDNAFGDGTVQYLDVIDLEIWLYEHIKKNLA